MLRMSVCWLLLATWLAVPSIVGWADESGEVDPPLPDGSAAAQAVTATLRMPAGFKVELFAAEPQLASPVAICLDEHNRVYVAEEFRFNRGTEENRTRSFLLDDDLQIKSLEERLAMFRKHADKFTGGMDWFTRYTDQVRRLEDRNGDGRAEIATVFASGFNGPLDGLAAGLIARDGDVYLTCIPNLWRLRDDNNDGQAELRESLLSGFGVNAGFLGHDLHGLCWGPEGKLYFSVGDRGYNVRTKEGATLAQPRRGAVFRCNPDGTDFEVIHHGLRNPQELAFDEFGNLFAADNNCDKGDHSRLVYVVEGGDSGWNMAYQSMPAPYETGPWHAEQMWHLADDEAAEKVRPAWVLPPVGKLGAGPSGFAYCGAAGWSDHFRGRFFHCNYTGNGGLETFRVKPQGASFEIEGYEDFLKPLSITDAEFGYDGKLYVSDFVGLDWSGKTRGGRIYTVCDPAVASAAESLQVKQLFAAGFHQQTNDELAKLLVHHDQRVRQRAQFELAARGDEALPLLEKLVMPDNASFARLHALWALGMIGKTVPGVLTTLTQLLADPNAEIRTQAARTLGDVRCPAAGPQLVALLHDDSPRVQLHAAIALARIEHRPAFDGLVSLLRTNQNRDKYLRHAVVFALSKAASHDQIVLLANDPEVAVRMGALLVLRHWPSPEVKRFLHDPEWSLVTEAARAINDLPIETATVELAALADNVAVATDEVPEALTRRVINANFRRGRSENATAVAQLAGIPRLSIAMRREALAALADWSNPTARDRVNGNWRPVEARDPAIVRMAVQPELAKLLSSSTGELQPLVTGLVTKLELKADNATFLSWAADDSREASVRIAALELLCSRRHPQAKTLVIAAIFATNRDLAIAAIQLSVKYFADTALPPISKRLNDSATPITVRQQSLRSLAEIKSPAGDELLRHWSAELVAGDVSPPLQLDVIETIAARNSVELTKAIEPFEKAREKGDPLQQLQIALVGGDTDRGRQVFASHRQAQCIRCHRIGEQGGDAGPNLSRVSVMNDRQHLLESLIVPNAKIATGFGSVTLSLSDGTTVGGVIKSENDEIVELLTPQNELRRIKVAEIDDRSPPNSAMPAMDKVLTPGELRDVVEYLSTLK